MNYPFKCYLLPVPFVLAKKTFICAQNKEMHIFNGYFIFSKLLREADATPPPPPLVRDALKTCFTRVLTIFLVPNVSSVSIFKCMHGVFIVHGFGVKDCLAMDCLDSLACAEHCLKDQAKHSFADFF